MINRIIRSCKNTPVLTQQRYNYLTPIQKPITSLALQSFIELSTQTLQFCHDEFFIAPQASVVCGAFVFRVGLEFAGLFFQSLNGKNKDNWVNRWIQKIFIVDLRRDVTFYQLSPDKYTEMAQYYKPEQLFTNLLKTYSLLNFMRGAFNLISNQTHQAFYASSIIPLHLYDPYFILPLCVIAVNYLILSGSNHPFLIHLVRKQNKLMCLNFAFMSGLLFVASPAIFPLSYLGIGLAHLSMRRMKRSITNWKSYLLNMISKKNRQ